LKKLQYDIEKANNPQGSESAIKTEDKKLAKTDKAWDPGQENNWKSARLFPK